MNRRRALLGSLSALFVAPAIVRASSLMPIKPLAVGDGVPLFSSAHPVTDLGKQKIGDDDILVWTGIAWVSMLEESKKVYTVKTYQPSEKP